MTVVMSGGDPTQGSTTAVVGVGRVSTGGGRGSRGTLRHSGTRIRNSAAAGSSHSALGGQPLAGAEPSAKLDIKHRFEITGKLGSGTYGKVSLAYDHKTEREVAVKLIKKSAIENKQDLVRIRREIRIMSMLKHPNIIQIYEVFENKDKIILVMEYANGGELYDYVSKFGSLPEAEARRIFRQITSAVLYCHKHKVAHRDLKLENILLDARNNAKIADFGLSNYFSDKNLLATFCGSPLYASPEIINGTPYRGPEVDCWSLGILLYTLVYGSMPFDGRDFNRMVRQIKRGAYYEPDTPSTSMLIRNMLRVNPERRADIDDIASHWWLNLEENMPVIQELPENQITDHTPLTERAEIMVVQDLADETDVFMEFGHLSAATRQKIEEFRRRRKEAEEYNESSPVKPPKSRRTSLKSGETELAEMTAREKSLRAVVEEPKPAPAAKLDQSAFQDPLDRLRQLESRLQSGTSAPIAEPMKKEKVRKPSVEEKLKEDVEKESQPPASETKQKRKKSLKKERRESVDEKAKTESSKVAEKKCPTFISPTRRGSRGGVLSSQASFLTVESTFKKSAVKTEPTVEDDVTAAALEDVRQQTRQYWKMGTDSLNLLMNQVLEQMEKGPVSLNLIARIKAHAFYDQRPMVKELLESIIAAQPASVQKETSKIIQQQSQELIRRQTSNKGIGATAATTADATVPKKPQKMNTVLEAKPLEMPAIILSPKTNGLEKYRVAELPNQVELKRSILKVLDDRPWHSVEVGFSTDEETSSNNTDSGTALANATDEKADRKAYVGGTAPKFIGTRSTQSEPRDEFELDDEEFYEDEDEADDEEVYESDIDELADEVELGGGDAATERPPTKTPAPPRIVGNLAENLQPADGPALSPNHLSTTLDRQGLVKRQSKGKYQFLHNQVEMYGRGVSMEAESPPVARRRIGGPQPHVEQSPILFDKAKNYLINPDKPDDSDSEDVIQRKSRSPARGKTVVGSSAPTWLQTRDPSASDNKSTSSAATSAPHSQEDISQKPTLVEDIKNNKVVEDDKQARKMENDKNKDDGDEEEEEEEEETDDESGGIAAPFRPRPSTIIGFRTIQPIGADGVRKEAPIVKVKPQAPTNVVAPTRKLSAELTAATPAAANAPAKSGNSIRLASYQRKGSGTGDSFDASAVGERQKHESASAYIRRKNRERRARNQTIAITSDEAWTGWSAENPENHFPEEGARRKSSLTGRLSVERSLDNDHRPTDDRRYEPNYLRQAYVDRRKSYHEMTPLRAAAEAAAAAAAESRCFSPFGAVASSAYDRYGGEVGGYGAGGNYHHYRPAAGAVPTSISRYEDEIYHAFYPNSTLHGDSSYNPSHRNRFEVYRTRAERAGDVSYGGPSYRSVTAGSGSYYNSAADRPSSTYVADAYRRYEDGGPRRLLYDPEPAVASGDYSVSVTPYGVVPPDSPTGGTSNGRPRGGNSGVARRLSSTSRDDARRSRARSQSTDRLMAAVMRDDVETSEALLNARLMTPEVGDYGYVAYHDSAGGRLSAAAVGAGHYDLGPSGAGTGVSGSNRSILRSKPSFDSDTRPSYLTAKDTAATGNSRLATDISAEITGGGVAVVSPPKKHSFLNLTRLRTTEVTANSVLPDEDYKRPRSPIDRLKSLFRSSGAGHKKNSGGRDAPTALTVASGSSSSASLRYSDVGYGSSAKRYGGATSSSRFGFTGSTVSGAKSSPRSWYDDPHHY